MRSPTSERSERMGWAREWGDGSGRGRAEQVSKASERTRLGPTAHPGAQRWCV